MQECPPALSEVTGDAGWPICSAVFYPESGLEPADRNSPLKNAAREYAPVENQKKHSFWKRGIREVGSGRKDH